MSYISVRADSGSLVENVFNPDYLPYQLHSFRKPYFELSIGVQTFGFTIGSVLVQAAPAWAFGRRSQQIIGVWKVSKKTISGERTNEKSRVCDGCRRLHRIPFGQVSAISKLEGHWRLFPAWKELTSGPAQSNFCPMRFAERPEAGSDPRNVPAQPYFPSRRAKPSNLVLGGSYRNF